MCPPCPPSPSSLFPQPMVVRPPPQPTQADFSPCFFSSSPLSAPPTAPTARALLVPHGAQARHGGPLLEPVPEALGRRRRRHRLRRAVRRAGSVHAFSAVRQAGFVGRKGVKQSGECESSFFLAKNFRKSLIVCFLVSQLFHDVSCEQEELDSVRSGCCKNLGARIDAWLFFLYPKAHGPKRTAK